MWYSGLITWLARNLMRLILGAEEAGGSGAEKKSQVINVIVPAILRNGKGAQLREIVGAQSVQLVIGIIIDAVIELLNMMHGDEWLEILKTKSDDEAAE